MKVILTQEHHQLGNIGDIIDVKNGFGRNFLFPKNIAIPYSQQNYSSFEQKKKQLETENSKKIELARKVKNILESKNLVLIESASDDGHLYGSIKSNKIIKELNLLIGENLLEKSHINLEKPIKDVGIHKVELVIHPEVEIKIIAYASRTSSEAEKLIKSMRHHSSAETEQNSENPTQQSQ